MTKLRWAVRQDIEDILSLIEEYHLQEGLSRHSRSTIKPVIEDLFEAPKRGRIVLAEQENEAVGYALLVTRPSFEWASDVAVIDEIFVKGKAREHGLGRRLIAFIEEHAASEGLPKLTLEVSTHNVSAREFYRAVGFSKIDREIYARTIGGPR